MKIPVISVEAIRGCGLSSLVLMTGREVELLTVKCSCVDGFVIRVWEKWQRTLLLEHL